MPTDPLREALLRVADGDRSAFSLVYEALEPKVAALCRRRLGEATLADDVTQETLVKVFVHADAYDPERGSPLAWALGVASWECRTALRRRHRGRIDDVRLEPVDPRHSPEDHAITVQLLEDVSQVLGRLSAADRQTLLAVWADGPRPDVGAAAFRKRVQRALGRFRARWSPDEA